MDKRSEGRKGNVKWNALQLLEKPENTIYYTSFPSDKGLFTFGFSTKFLCLRNSPSFIMLASFPITTVLLVNGMPKYDQKLFGVLSCQGQVERKEAIFGASHLMVSLEEEEGSPRCIIVDIIQDKELSIHPLQMWLNNRECWVRSRGISIPAGGPSGNLPFFLMWPI